MLCILLRRTHHNRCNLPGIIEVSPPVQAEISYANQVETDRSPPVVQSVSAKDKGVIEIDIDDDEEPELVRPGKRLQHSIQFHAAVVTILC